MRVACKCSSNKKVMAAIIYTKYEKRKILTRSAVCRNMVIRGIFTLYKHYLLLVIYKYKRLRENSKDL